MVLSKNGKIRDIVFTRVLAFIASAAIILYFFPKETENSYTYDINRPWTYSLLTAPFDLPVHLDSISAQAVRDSIERTFEPVYERDMIVEKTILSEYASRLSGMSGDLLLPAADQRRLLDAITSIYHTGVVDAATYSAIQSGKLPAVRMIHDNVAISVPTGAYNSARSAYTLLDSLFPSPDYHEAIRTTGLSDLLQPNIRLDTIENERLRREVYLKAMAPIGVIQQGERIIDKGELVTPQLYTVLRTYEELAAERGARSSKSAVYPLAGQLMYIVIVLAALYAYLYFFRPAFYGSSRIILFLMLIIVSFSLMAFAMASAMTAGLYLVPFAMIPVMTLIFLDSRTAFFTHVITVVLCSIIAPFPLEFFFMQIAVGASAIDSLKDLSRRSQLLRTALIVFAVYCLSYVAVELMHNGKLEALEGRMIGYFAINAVFISFAYVLIFVFEKLFGFTSRVTLVELSDINNPLLRELSEECPGTFQHSMSVSNLATEAARRIGANVQMVRAGALYHDIGKIENPAFFTENQHGVNPHDSLSPLQSARIVIGHVTDGLKLAEKAKLPETIRKFIREHHGSGTARYFYTTWANAHPGEEIDPAPFTYPGPNPQSRETSILMMADAVEAASRSLKEHTPEAITMLVNRIIDSQIAEGLHSESPISFRDVTEIKRCFSSRLRTMYHSRISYPEAIKKGDRQKSSI